MNWRHPCWDELGIEPTSEQRAIRVAYTRKLKAIDPESDPQAFIALREAYERAQQQAEWVDLSDEDDESGDDDVASSALYEEDDTAGYAYSPITGARVPIDDSRPDPDAPWRALHDLLLPDGTRRQPPLDEAWKQELGGAVDAVLADPRLEQVGFQADADRWLAELLARAWPASDSILRRVAAVFGWDRRTEGTAYQSPAIDYINARLRDAARYGAATAPEVGAAAGPAPAPSTPPATLTAPLFEPEWRPEATIDIAIDGSASGADAAPHFGRSWQGAEPDEMSFGPADPSSQPTAPPQASPWQPLSVEAHAEALAALLYERTTPKSAWPDPAQREAMLGHWRAIIADPRMQDISFFDEADRWFANQISRAIPWSDPLVIPATEFFGWMAQEGTIRQDWARDELTRRYRTLKFMAEVEQHGHPLNPAWRDLVTPGGDTSTGRVPKARVRELLTRVREEFPDLEGCFDADRLNHWERRRNVGKASGGRGSSWSAWIFPILFAAFLLIRAFTAPTEDRSPPVAIATASDTLLGDKPADIAHALEGYDPALTWAAIQSKNPALAKAMDALWDAEHKKRSPRSEFRVEVSELFQVWMRAGGDQAPFALLAEEERLGLDIAKRMRARSIQECADQLAGRTKVPTAIMDEFAKRRQALFAQFLLATPDRRKPVAGTKATAERKFTVPRAVITTASAQSGIPRERFLEAMNFKGSAADQCNGRIALIEAVLALPQKQADPLLRVM